MSRIYGSNVFSEDVMRARLPRTAYLALRKTIDEGVPLDRSIASVVANAMKEWAMERGATHYCHWFQPMTEVTAEKHDSFISPLGDGRTIMEFSGKELIQGEPDASSFPSGGLRGTFEARGYTAWDCTSPVFVKKNGDTVALYIPCAFFSYNSQSLDKKTPLLRSMELLSKQAVRVIRALGNKTVNRVIATLGAEQEYFLVDAAFASKRLDLMLCGRTLFGAPPPKGQEMDDHYFGTLHERVANYMHELNVELWKLGIPAKTQHNEVAPAQYELAPIYGTVNVATDQNQLTMEIMRRVAPHHGFMCLLHEKPFAGVNGSGKHNNWGLSTDDGKNIFDPGETPHENMQFLVFLGAVIKAIGKYSEILRAAAACAGNDHRLGANEAPPAIVSIFLGERLTEIFEDFARGKDMRQEKQDRLKLGITTIPPIPRDSADRNRTSPFAFTGNKFEFRMLGSSQSTSGPNFILNTIVADVLSEIADRLEGAYDKRKSTEEILSEIAEEYSHIIFNGDNYTEEWVEEAHKRGLPNIPDTVDSIHSMLDAKNEEVFVRNGVFTSTEWHARHEILLERYCQAINIEALTTLQMARKQILPVVLKYSGSVARSALDLKELGIDAETQTRIAEELSALTSELNATLNVLEAAVDKAKTVTEKKAEFYRDSVKPAMHNVRVVVDKLELMVDAEMWPLPSYADMLFL
ncbi:MAG: glutamine synthetase III [Abditibacteriota bacterium]|nr:glutamine synthetase III [Abditibacteriota bacterium]